VTTPDAASISSAVLVRNGAVTHAFAMDQRDVGLSFTVGNGALTITAPPHGNVAPPGYYMLFLLNSSGVPSIARFTQIGLQPDFSLTATPSSQNALQGSAASYTLTVTPLAGFNGNATFSVSGLPTGATASFNPTSVSGSGSSTMTVTTANNSPGGSYTLTITASSGSLSHSTTVTLVVNSVIAPTVSSVTPNIGLTGGGTGVTIAGTNFVSGATVTFGGTAATSVVVVSGTQITATTPAHAAGAVTVTVTNPDTQSGSLSNGFTYNTGMISFAQVASATPQTPTQVVPVAVAGAESATDLNIVVVGWSDTTSTVQSVQDSAGNVYSLAIGPTTGTGLRQAIYYATNIAGGNNTITVTFSQAVSYPDIRALEYQGLVALDVIAGASGNSISASSGTATTTTANELIFGAN